MTPEQQAALVMAQASAALIEMQGMIVTNRERECNGMAYAYDEAAFLKLIETYGLGYNTVLTTLQGR